MGSKTFALQMADHAARAHRQSMASRIIGERAAEALRNEHRLETS
jgi:hypothetical protein